MEAHVAQTCVRQIAERQVEGGGFADHPGGRDRPDITCWAILALTAAGRSDDSVDVARRWLAKAQLADGRVCISRKHKDTIWPTPLAVLAWHGQPEYRTSRERALQFLLEFDQISAGDAPDDIIGHDGSIEGWPWVAEAHPWVEPTAYSLMALSSTEYRGHQRSKEAVRLLLDRQLPNGGWNYGNITVFQQELHPMPETTGIALQALAGLVPRERVGKSILYLQSRLTALSTPFAAAWAILGLAAWQERPHDPREQFVGILEQQRTFGPFDTVSLSLLVLAWYCPNGLLATVPSTGQGGQS
jgi:hypothetical protein